MSRPHQSACGGATCQHEKTKTWLRKQSNRLLPVPYFLVTCTVPPEIRDVIRQHRRAGFNAIFDAGAEMLRACTAESRYLQGGQPGFFGVLHTWGRDPLIFHPHVHFVVAGGAVARDGSQWLSTPANFLFPHAKMCAKYKAFFKEQMRHAGLLHLIPGDVWKRKWVVDVRPVGGGQSVLKYLAPYVYRVAISDNRIVACTDQEVTYRYQPSGTKKWKTRTVTGHQFVSGFARHVLPAGFRKVRYYGWWAANSRTTFDRLKWLVWLWKGWTWWLGSGVAPAREPCSPQTPRCRHCGGDLHLIRVTDQSGRTLHIGALLEHTTDYLDSG